MAISRVLIKNFRSIRRCEFKPSALCALVGENNAGKSNILDALHRVLAREWVTVRNFTEEDIHGYAPDRDIVIELDFDPPIKYQPFKYGPAADIPTLRFTLTRYKVDSAKGRKGDLRLEQSCLDAKLNAVMVPAQAPQRGQKTPFKPLTNIPEEVRDQMPAIFIGTDRQLADQLPSSRHGLLRRLFEDVDAALKSTQIDVMEGGKNLKKPAHDVFLERLRAALDVLRIEEFVDLEDMVRRYSLENLGYDTVKDKDRFEFRFDLFDSFDFFKALRLAFREGAIVTDATAMGHGAQNALIIAIFQAYERLRKRGAIFLIEEPELFLHPHRRRFFYQALRRVANDNQIIYTTHSTHFVTVPEFEEVRIVYRDDAGGTAARGSAMAATPQLREKLRKEFDPERNELFFAKHVLLVEGDTEKLALPEFASRLDIDLNRLGCSVVEVGGKRGLLSFAEIIISFDIPVTVVFDTDSSDFAKEKKDEEKEYNASLHKLAGSKTNVVELDRDYEARLRADIGEALYTKLCQRYPGVSKAIRARLIAADPACPIPALAQECLASLLSPAAPPASSSSHEEPTT